MGEYNRIRVKTDDTFLTALSLPYLKIKRDLVLTGPSVALPWNAQTTKTITWDFRGYTNWGNVKVEWHRNSTIGWMTQGTVAVNNQTGATDPFAGTGAFDWYVDPAEETTGATPQQQ